MRMMFKYKGISIPSPEAKIWGHFGCFCPGETAAILSEIGVLVAIADLQHLFALQLRDQLVWKKIRAVMVNQKIARLLNGETRDSAIVKLNLIRKTLLIRLFQIQIEDSPKEAGKEAAVSNHAHPVFRISVPGKQQVQHAHSTRYARRAFFPSTRPPALLGDWLQETQVWIIIAQVSRGQPMFDANAADAFNQLLKVNSAHFVQVRNAQQGKTEPLGKDRPSLDSPFHQAAIKMRQAVFSPVLKTFTVDRGIS